MAKRMWPWAFRHVERELHDWPSAAETLEEVVIAVSARLRDAPEVGRNLNGYLITAFHHNVRSRRIRDHRLADAYPFECDTEKRECYIGDHKHQLT
jgi:hypothetical protein